MPSSAPPYYDPTLNINRVTMDWPIGGDPTMTLTPPIGASADHIKVWHNTVSNWGTSTLLDTISPHSTSYTDVGRAKDATPNYYWFIAYDAAELFAGKGNGVACLYAISNGPASFAPLATNLAFPIDIELGGHFEETITASFASCTVHTAYTHPIGQPDNPTPDYLGINAFVQNATFPLGTNEVAVTNNQHVAPRYAACAWTAAGGVPTPGPGAAVTPYPFNPPSWVGSIPVQALSQNSGAGNFLTIEWTVDDVDAPAPNSGGGNVFGAPNSTLGGVAFPASVSYSGPDGGFGFPGQGGIAGGAGVRPPPARNQLGLLVTPNSVPLPCIPCCWTEAPICPPTLGSYAHG